MTTTITTVEAPGETARVTRSPPHDQAGAVALAGEINGRSRSRLPMRRKDDGWEAVTDLEPGRYAYTFVVDGEWITDPANPATVRDGENVHSLREVEAGAASAR